MSQHWIEKIKFLAIGALNTAIDIVLFLILGSFIGLPMLAANSISTSAGMVTSFLLNRKHTFGSGGRVSLKEVTAFFGVTAVGLWILQPLVIAGVTQLMPESWEPPVVALGAKLVATVVSLLWNYYLYKYVVFKK
ncbi:GtrA family protein [Galactobacter valiniphilus]|uniref:GtrA family protein n=1 Tax=Galactobacter valiniphilus TaxID=2676122 RepID=A0A399JAY4_9MICC|nr:GtrA family protein [Galactobacter valiniphilus]RII42735.1 GtrA family protein [Galactobacter valiniphilus]